MTSYVSEAIHTPFQHQMPFLSFRLFRGIIRSMGWRYTIYRLTYEFSKRTGWLRRKFPKYPPSPPCEVTRDQWRNSSVVFFRFPVRAARTSSVPCEVVTRVHRFLKGELRFFHGEWLPMGDWHTHPLTGFRYPVSQHWTTIPDFSSKAGDIKYIWEKSRFTFLYDLIRSDHFTGSDHSITVFDQIESWIRSNPVNCGPNWVCSQEISIRVLNWTFALFYYRDSPRLSNHFFLECIGSIYHQIKHVEANHAFARRAVRNNHALTEALALYLIGLLFPFFNESTNWKRIGKQRFEEEISFQIQEDGTFLQHSMIYHRMVIQLFTWGIQLAHLNGEQWSEMVYDRARRSVHFLRCCQDVVSGQLPNYGNNDGTLLFPLTDCHFLDFRPQMLALASKVGYELDYGKGPWEEESEWLGLTLQNKGTPGGVGSAVFSFEQGGYFVHKYVTEGKTALTFLRCGKYTNRPGQADNLHFDLWVNGINLLRDAGTYGYLGEESLVRYFSGTASHNTIMLGNADQMQKRLRFVWLHWIKKSNGHWKRKREGNAGNQVVFEGEFEGFRHLGNGIVHRRKVTISEEKLLWVVEDWVSNVPVGVPVCQLWHPYPEFMAHYYLRCFLKDGCELHPTVTGGWHSETYGHKTPAIALAFSTGESYLRTEIGSRGPDAVAALMV